MKVCSNNLFWVFILSTLLLVTSCSNKAEPEEIVQFTSIDRNALITPDYSGIVVPPNIAPLNFVVEEDGVKYYIEISSKTGSSIKMFTLGSRIVIPQKLWTKLICANKGNDLYIDISVKKQDGKWYRYKTISNHIATESIDGYIAYRKMTVAQHLFRRMGVFCRDLSSYDEKLVLDSNYLHGGCINCHAFVKNNPEKMLIGIRSYDTFGTSTLLVQGDEVEKINTKIGYTSWHPSGRLAAYSINKLPMVFHTNMKEIRESIETKSLIAYYDFRKKEVNKIDVWSKTDRLESWPAWSADGKYLYSCNAPSLWSEASGDGLSEAINRYKDIKYDLVRISYDIDQDKWGQPETLISAKDTGMSISMPRTSPDGRWLIFCMADYGFFPLWNPASDIYIVDLRLAEETGQYEYRKLQLSSDQAEGWQSFSSNSRWIAFSSKRDNGAFARTYLSYIDNDGNASKPFLIPQRDPEFYESCLDTYTVPELLTGPITKTREELARSIRGKRQTEIDMPITMATPSSGTMVIPQSYRSE